MISAPSEMRCRSMPVKLMTVNTAASTSGIDSATTAPARRPRLSRLTPSTMAIASHRASMNSSTACSTITVWLATSIGLDADRQVFGDPRHGFGHVVPE